MPRSFKQYMEYFRENPLPLKVLRNAKARSQVRRAREAGDIGGPVAVLKEPIAEAAQACPDRKMKAVASVMKLGTAEARVGAERGVPELTARRAHDHR